MRATRVLVADDDELFRTALVEVVEADRRFEVVGTRTSGSDVVDAVRALAAELVLLDVRMPEGGVVAARALRHAVEQGRLDPVRVVVLSAHATAATVVELLREGVVGFLVKGEPAHDLPDLLVRCAAGQVVLATPAAATALLHLVDGDRPHHPSDQVRTAPRH
ncbi:response regulator [Nocardioides aurantiacus]|uniref:response regulator n=1 Tax=Nocardioides aurantiacus TaxID=86796 RepID=UPI0014775616|nr:response regulator transcription factor [Nocardioides aurantiacus]